MKSLSRLHLLLLLRPIGPGQHRRPADEAEIPADAEKDQRTPEMHDAHAGERDERAADEEEEAGGDDALGSEAGDQRAGEEARARTWPGRATGCRAAAASCVVVMHDHGERRGGHHEAHQRIGARPRSPPRRGTSAGATISPSGRPRIRAGRSPAAGGMSRKSRTMPRRAPATACGEIGAGEGNAGERGRRCRSTRLRPDDRRRDAAGQDQRDRARAGTPALAVSAAAKRYCCTKAAAKPTRNAPRQSTRKRCRWSSPSAATSAPTAPTDRPATEAGSPADAAHQQRRRHGAARGPDDEGGDRQASRATCRRREGRSRRAPPSGDGDRRRRRRRAPGRWRGQRRCGAPAGRRRACEASRSCRRSPGACTKERRCEGERPFLAACTRVRPGSRTSRADPRDRHAAPRPPQRENRASRSGGTAARIS